MSIQIAELVVSSISALASVVQAWQAVRTATPQPSSRQIDRVLKSRPSGPLRDTVILLDKVISDEILESILKNIKRAEKRFADALKDPRNTPQDHQKEEEIATVAICDELNRVKRLNEGSLPPELDKLWLSFRCAA